MWTLDRPSTREPLIALMLRAGVALAIIGVSLPFAKGQPAGNANANAGSASGSFAIESEMLTYRALESNSEAVACDIASYLNHVPANFTNPPKGAVCDVKPGSNKSMIILMAFDNSEFSDFQIWRADMATLERLQDKADDVINAAPKDKLTAAGCPANLATRSGSSSSAAATATAAASSFLSMTPAGPPLALAQSVLAMMATEESVSPVGGTVQDQAFMNGVGRSLQTLGVNVIMPTSYSPYSLEPLVREDSPFLASLETTLEQRECLAGLATNDDNRIRRTLEEIDQFITVLTASTPAGNGSAAGLGTGSTAGATATQSTLTPSVTQGGSKTPKPAAPSAAPVPSVSHLTAVLSADGLARKLGVRAKLRDAPNQKSQHILLVKALESGGDVTRHSSVLGTSIRYSGGAVGTYALFTTEGDLECSGNVYDYGGDLKAKQFETDVRKFKSEPGKQIIFQNGGCNASATVR